MKSFLLTFDLEEFVVPNEFNLDVDNQLLFNISREGLKKIMSILNKYNIKATFFVTTEFAEHFPELIKKLCEEGNEIAYHSYSHSNIIDGKKFIFGKEKLEEISGASIIGFRAPRLNKISKNLLNDAKIKYDSSLHPTYIPGKYNNFFKSRKKFVEDGIVEVPVSVTPLLRLPFTWVWFRILPLIYSKICVKLSLLDSDFINLYFHPWEFVDLTKYDFSGKIPSSRTKNTGEKLIKKLEKFIKWCVEKNLKFETIKNYFNLLV